MSGGPESERRTFLLTTDRSFGPRRIEEQCRTYAPVLDSLRVTGTVTFNDDRSYVDNTTSSGQSSFELGPECLRILGTDTACDMVQRGFLDVGLRMTHVHVDWLRWTKSAITHKTERFL
jgi:hypothetical protein